MKVAAAFVEKTGFADFGIQELLSLAALAGLPTAGLFAPDLPFPPVAPPLLRPAHFPSFPLVQMHVAPEHLPTLAGLLDRCVSVGHFGEVLAAGHTDAAFAASLSAAAPRIAQEAACPSTFCLDVRSHGLRLSSAEKNARLAALSLPPFAGKVCLESPERLFLLEEAHGPDGQLRARMLLRSLVPRRRPRPFYARFALSDRAFLGPTSTVAELAFLMCNQAQVRPGSLVLDPFVGTGSILVAAAALGGLCWGTDIDVRVLLGYGVGQLNAKSSFAAAVQQAGWRVDGFLNFRQYDLPLPELLRADCGQPFAVPGFFDALVCDPPYGRRAAAKQTASPGPEPAPSPTDTPGPYFIPTAKASCAELTGRLFELAARHLRPGGRLVFLYPVEEGDDPTDAFAAVPGFRLAGASRNDCNSKFARFLFTFQREG